MNGFGTHLGAKIDASSRLPPRAPLGSFSTNFGAHFGSILDPFVPFWRPFVLLWIPFGILWLPLDKRLAPIGPLWTPFGLLLLIFGMIWHHFGRNCVVVVIF